MDVDQGRESDDEICKLIQISEIIILEAGDLSNKLKKDMDIGIIDIDLSDELSGVLMTVYTCLEKEENDPTGHQKYKCYIVKINGVEVSIQTIVEKVKAKNIKINFLVATPTAELMTLFKGFFNEVRTGVTRFIVRKSVLKKSTKRDYCGRPISEDLSGKNFTQNISEYGLINDHIRFLQGITLAPERRTRVLRSLGPLAQCILMVVEDEYCTKLNSAIMNSLQMLPMATEIINCLREARSPGAVSGVLKELGNILLLTTARSTQKIFPPLLLIIYMWKIKPDALEWSFSGAPMIKFYCAVSKVITFRMRSGASPLLTAEAIFHSMFGTYLDDLVLLQQITNHSKWHQRKDMNSIFSKRSEKPQILIKPISFKYVTKAVQALFTKRPGNEVGIGRPSFSGFRRRHFTQEFLSYLTRGKNAINYSSDPLQLLYALRKVKDALIDKKDNDKIQLAGTQEWEEYNDSSWVESNFIPIEGNIRFFGY